MLEQDMKVHEERVVQAQAQSQQFAQAGHYDKDTIAEREQIVVQKFQALQVSGQLHLNSYTPCRRFKKHLTQGECEFQVDKLIGTSKWNIYSLSDKPNLKITQEVGAFENSLPNVVYFPKIFHRWCMYFKWSRSMGYHVPRTQVILGIRRFNLACEEVTSFLGLCQIL